MRPPGASEAGSGPLGDPQKALLAASAALERKGSATRQLASPPGCRAARESDRGGRAASRPGGTARTLAAPPRPGAVYRGPYSSRKV